jgi:hypothetical protein
MVCVLTAVPIQFELELKCLHAAALIVKAQVRQDTSCGEGLDICLLTQQRLFLISTS